MNRYARHTAGHVMDTNFVVTSENKKIKEVIQELSSCNGKECFMDYLYVLNDKQELKGVISIGDLFRNNQNLTVKKIMKTKIFHINVYSKDEVAAHTAMRKKIKAIPVLEKKKMVGVIKPKKVLNIMHKSAQEDFLRMAGIDQKHLEYDDSMKIPIYKSVYHRAPWLLIGLVGILIGAGFMGFFEEQLQKYIILAFFTPVIVYLSGALGAQNITISVRDIASKDKNFSRIKYFLKQTTIAFFIGLIVSIITFLILALLWKEPKIGLIIGGSLIIAMMSTSIVSLGTTLLIDKMGKDPALGSGPIATVISDVLSIVIYLFSAVMFLA